jgi:hypothetical protein
MALSATDKARLNAEAAKLRRILANGASGVTADGTTVTYDLASCRQRLKDITRALNPSRRPAFSRFNMGGF